MAAGIPTRIIRHLAGYAGPWSAFLLCAVALAFCTGAIPAVRFTAEEIRVTVQPRHILVDAFYQYRNPFPFPVIQGYVLPFPEDEAHSPPAGVELVQQTPERRWIPVSQSLGRHRFSIAFPGSGEVTLHLRYRQGTPRERGTYILTTTASWLRPLERAVYRLVPDGVRITGSNYPMAPEATGAFRWTRERFMPPEDWHFTWREA